MLINHSDPTSGVIRKLPGTSLNSRTEQNPRLHLKFSVLTITVHKFSLFLNATGYTISSLTYIVSSYYFLFLTEHTARFLRPIIWVSWSPRPWQWSASLRSSLFSYDACVIFSLFRCKFFTEYILHLITV